MRRGSIGHFVAGEMYGTTNWSSRCGIRGIRVTVPLKSRRAGVTRPCFFRLSITAVLISEICFGDNEEEMEEDESEFNSLRVSYRVSS